MVLLRGFWIGTLYKLLGSIVSDGSNSSFILESGEKEVKAPTISREKTMLYHQRLGHIGEKGLQVLHDNDMV